MCCGFSLLSPNLTLYWGKLGDIFNQKRSGYFVHFVRVNYCENSLKESTHSGPPLRT